MDGDSAVFDELRELLGDASFHSFIETPLRHHAGHDIAPRSFGLSFTSNRRLEHTGISPRAPLDTPLTHYLTKR
jgi:hypothetical protein